MVAKQVDAWAQLLAAAKAGDTRACAKFLKAVTPVLRGIVRAKGLGLRDACCQDVLQDVLLAVHLKRQRWDSEAPIRLFLYAIARHKVVDAFRARGHKIDVPTDDFVDVLAANAGTDPTEAAGITKRIRMPNARLAIIFRKIGLEVASVAKTGGALMISQGAVCAALHRALKTLAILTERHVT